MLRFLKKVFQFLFSRLFLVGFMLVLQVALLIAGVWYLGTNFFYIYLLFCLFSLMMVIGVVNRTDNPAYKITWIIAILLLPVVGWLFYLLFGYRRIPRKLQDRIDFAQEETRLHMPPNRTCSELLEMQDTYLAAQCRYIYATSGYPAMPGAPAEYYPVGELMFARMLEELRKAEKYIFLEYFIVRPGQMWDAVFTILKEKIAQGVEVRMMYDDLGSITTLPRRYDRMIREAGVHVLVFNPFRPRVNIILNHRDHRKVMVIDGRVAFCGGINLADEYINAVDRFGHWKDTGVLLRGEAVWPFAFMFLQQWRFATGEPLDYDHYRHSHQLIADPADGLIQPFGDSPLDQDNVTEVAYLHIIFQAERYVYITTPYLVIDQEMEVALSAAAKRGVDVRIITPAHYDKWYVHTLTRSHYAALIQAGVKIYEYTPGFMHGKMFVADDRVCMVGTCNMDFRSFYLHFECSVTFYHSPIVAQVKTDLMQCQAISRQITLQEARSAPLRIRLLRAVLKLFAPLL